MTDNLIAIQFDSPTIRYQAAGKCIYCGSTRYSGAEIRPLSDEHIVPAGLSGNLVLPRASCRGCAKITGTIEGAVLRTVLWAPRTLLNLRTRRARERPTKFKTMATYANESAETSIELPIEDYPTVLYFPQLGPPGILANRPRHHADMRGMWVYALNLNPNCFAKYGLKSMATAVLDAQRFSQMLGKIPHSYVAAQCNKITLKPLLLEHILGSGEYPWHFVGGPEQEPAPTRSLHELSHYEKLFNNKRYLIVLIRLFAHLGAPSFSVVAGEILA